MNVICFLLVCSIQNRIPNNTGGDTILRMLLFWMMFLPVGDHWSMDCRRKGYHPPRLICSAATVALLLQVCFIYWFSSIFKNDATWRVHHTAVHLAFGMESFQLPLAAWLLNYPAVTKVMTQTTLFLQEIMPFAALAPVLTFWRIRTFAAASFMAFHLLGLGLTMRLGLFPVIAAAAWLPFLPPPLFSMLRRRIKVGYSSSLSGGTDNEGATLPLRPRLSGTNWASYIPLLFLLQILWWNLANTFPATAGTLMPAWLRNGTYWSGINQFWAFFSPRPATRDGWYVAVATLSDGSQIDPIHDGSPVSWSKPQDGVASEYANSRWQKYLTSMFHGRRAPRMHAYVHFLKNRWEKLHPDRPISSLELYFMLQDNFYPSDGIRKVRVFPFRSVNNSGNARFEGDLRQDTLDAATETSTVPSQ
jgi:hypothetical protein